LLWQTVGQVQLTPEAHRRGNLALEDLLQGANPDRREHRVEVLGGDGGVAAQLQPRLAGERGDVGGGVEERVALGGIGQAHLDQPALAVGVLVDRPGILGDGLVDLDDLA
jgi:hypothetical protein